MSEEFQPVVEYSDLDPGALRALRAGLGSVACMVSRLSEVDPTRGSGQIDDRTRCLWTADGRRVTIEAILGGGVIASCSKSVDPNAPKHGLYPEK
jgi:hypothetical protein